MPQVLGEMNTKAHRNVAFAFSSPGLSSTTRSSTLHSNHLSLAMNPFQQPPFDTFSIEHPPIFTPRIAAPPTRVRYPKQIEKNLTYLRGELRRANTLATVSVNPVVRLVEIP